MASRPPFTIPQGKSGPWEKVGGPELSDGDVRQWPGLPLYRPISETHYLTTLATVWVKDQKLDQPREFHQIVPERANVWLKFIGGISFIFACFPAFLALRPLMLETATVIE
jgi:hypothetical protein